MTDLEMIRVIIIDVMPTGMVTVMAMVMVQVEGKFHKDFKMLMLKCKKKQCKLIFFRQNFDFSSLLEFPKFRVRQPQKQYQAERS